MMLKQTLWTVSVAVIILRRCDDWKNDVYSLPEDKVCYVNYVDCVNVVVSIFGQGLTQSTAGYSAIYPKFI